MERKLKDKKIKEQKRLLKEKRKQQKHLNKLERKEKRKQRKLNKIARRKERKEKRIIRFNEKHKNENRDLPPFTKGEEIFNAVTHIVGGAIGIGIFIWCLIVSIVNGSAVNIVSSAIYGISVILLYTISSIYHFLNRNKAKKVFRTLDHCTIFLLIAGSYTPICLVALNNLCGHIMLFVVWAFAILGIVFNAINMYNKKIAVLSQICYIVTGWCAVFGFGYLYNVIGLNGLLYLTAGGIAYTLGAIFFALGSKIKYFHSIFHLFCIAGTILQFVCIIKYVL